MPITYWVDAERKVLRSKASGSLTIDDLRGYFAATRADPLVQPSMHRLMDVRDVTTLPASNEIRDLVFISRAQAPAPEARMAILATSDLGYGVAMMFKGLAGYGDRLVVVRDEKEALAWLADPNSPTERWSFDA